MKGEVISRSVSLLLVFFLRTNRRFLGRPRQTYAFERTVNDRLLAAAILPLLLCRYAAAAAASSSTIFVFLY